MADELEGFLEGDGEGTHVGGNAQGTELELRLESTLVILLAELLVDVNGDARGHVGAAGNGAGGAVVQAGQDEGVAAHHDAEVLAAGEADVFLRIGHVAGGVLGGNDVVNVGQTGHGGGFHGDVGLGLVVVDDDGQAGLGGNGAIVLVDLLLGLADEHGGQDAQSIDSADLLHRFGDGNGAFGGDVVGTRVDLHAAMDGILGHLQEVIVEALIMGVELAGGAEGEHAVNPVVCQVIDQAAVGFLIQVSILINRGNNGDHNSFWGKAHRLSLLFYGSHGVVSVPFWSNVISAGASRAARPGYLPAQTSA